MLDTCLTAGDVANLLGRSHSTVYAKWRTWVRVAKMPPPLLGGEEPLRWSRAQIVAWMDAPLSPPMRLAAAAYRAAEMAAAGTTHVSAEALDVEAGRRRLEARIMGDAT